jgi:hypothetical protein
MHARRDGHAISPLLASFLQVFEFTAAETLLWGRDLVSVYCVCFTLYALATRFYFI